MSEPDGGASAWPTVAEDPVSLDRLILSILGEVGGLPTGVVAERLARREAGRVAHSDKNARMFSQHVRQRLLALQAAGLVTTLDTEKPVCWVRTGAGPMALGENP